MACGDGTVYLKYDNSTKSVDLKSSDLEISPGIEWRQIKRNRKHTAGKLKAGKIYQLPKQRFKLALTKATGKIAGDPHEMQALFLVSPQTETLVFSLYIVQITLD
jgi:hypothetical protein